MSLAYHPPVPSARAVSLALLGLSLALFVRFDLVESWAYLDRSDGDFQHYHRAGRHLLAGESPYATERFDYPPLVAYVAAPLGALELRDARAVWLAVNALALVGCAVLAWRLAGGDGVALAAVALVTIVAGTEAENLALGQVTPIVLLLVLLAVRWQASRPALAGGALGVAVALKLWPAVLAGTWLLRRRWRPLATVGLTAVLLTAGLHLALALTVPAPHVPQSSGYWMGTPAPLNFGLPAVALRLADPPTRGERLPFRWRHGDDPSQVTLTPRQALPSLLTSAALLLMAMAALGRAVARGAPGGRQEVLASLTLLSLCPLASPIAWYHYQLVQLPVVTVLGADAWRRRRGGARAARLVGLALLLVGATRAQTLGFGAYAARFGWTAEAPLALWAATTAAAAANLVLVAWCLRATAGAARSIAPTPSTAETS